MADLRQSRQPSANDRPDPLPGAGWPLGALVGGFIGVFVVLTAAVATRLGTVVRIDAAVSDRARRFALDHPLWLTTMRVVTRSAGNDVLLSVAAVMLVLALYRRLEIRFLCVLVVVGYCLRIGVRALVERPRPVDRLTVVSGWSYPSGHTFGSALAAITLVVLGFQLFPGRRARTWLLVLVGTWAVLVGMSRVAVVAHWPTDVLGAWLLVGSVAFAAAWFIPRVSAASAARRRRPRRRGRRR